MNTRQATPGSSREDGWYRIRIQGHLDQRWISWFDGLALTHDTHGTTLLRGHVIDHAVLHGLLAKVRDIGMPLVSITRERSRAASPPRLTPRIPDHVTSQAHDHS